MLADFIPEAIALGATYLADRRGALLLALMIALQNLPEGFNAYREIRSTTSIPHRRLFALMLVAALLGPLSGLLGYTFLQDSHAIVGGLMLFAAGGILYLTFEDIAPQVPLDNHSAPALGAVLGFAAGLLGQLVIG